MTQTFHFCINGQRVEAHYDDEFIQYTILPLIHHWQAMAQQKQRRIVLFLAAPPAVGKSTLATLFETLCAKDQSKPQLQALGMDGFHHYQSYILTHQVMVEGKEVPMKSVKGCPESFDYERFENYLLQIKEKDGTWPYYDRSQHDVVDDRIDVTSPIVLVEGNYLLLDEEPWNKLVTLCDEAIFIDATKEALKQRLIHRKIMGGSLPHEAIQFYEQSDGKNVERILAHRLPADIELVFDGKDYHIK